MTSNRDTEPGSAQLGPELPVQVQLPGPEPIRRSIRIACGLLGVFILALAGGVPFWIPEAPWWAPLPFAAFAAVLLVPALLSRRARTEDEWRAAFHRAVHLSALTRVLYLPGLGAMLLLYALRWMWPDFSLDVQPGPLLAWLVVGLVCIGMISATLANYYRAKAGL